MYCIFIDILKPLNIGNNINVHDFTSVCNRKIRSPIDCPLSWTNYGQVSLYISNVFFTYYFYI